MSKHLRKVRFSKQPHYRVMQYKSIRAGEQLSAIYGVRFKVLRHSGSGIPGKGRRHLSYRASAALSRNALCKNLNRTPIYVLDTDVARPRAPPSAVEGK